MRAHPTGAVIAAPNVTPMVDVMLVLLILFMILVPLLSQVHATLPKAGNPRSHPEEGTDHTLGIDMYGAYSLDRRPVRRDALPALLRDTFARADEHVLYVRADRNLDYATVLDAIEIARNNGVRVVGMITVAKR